MDPFQWKAIWSEVQILKALWRLYFLKLVFFQRTFMWFKHLLIRASYAETLFLVSPIDRIVCSRCYRQKPLDSEVSVGSMLISILRGHSHHQIRRSSRTTHSHQATALWFSTVSVPASYNPSDMFPFLFVASSSPLNRLFNRPFFF